jgi:hypothetical protein
MDKQRSVAIEALQISNDYVKCQRCGHDIPIVGKLNRPHNDKAVILQRRIKWIEEDYRYSSSQLCTLISFV